MHENTVSLQPSPPPNHTTNHAEKMQLKQILPIIVATPSLASTQFTHKMEFM
jgi:hypothetical protein